MYSVAMYKSHDDCIVRTNIQTVPCKSPDYPGKLATYLTGRFVVAYDVSCYKDRSAAWLSRPCPLMELKLNHI